MQTVTLNMYYTVKLDLGPLSMIAHVDWLVVGMRFKMSELGIRALPNLADMTGTVIEISLRNTGVTVQFDGAARPTVLHRDYIAPENAGGASMHQYVARANIDKYLDLLGDGDLTSQKRAFISKLLVKEEDKLAHDLEALEFAERRATNGRRQLNDVVRIRDGLVPGSADHSAAERLIATFTAIQELLDAFCHRIREKANSHHL